MKFARKVELSLHSIQGQLYGNEYKNPNITTFLFKSLPLSKSSFITFHLIACVNISRDTSLRTVWVD